MSKLKKEFLDLKSALTSEIFLKAPPFHQPFILQIDASSKGIGGVQSQMFDKEGEKPIAITKKKLNEAQSRYTATEKECLAVVKTIDHFAVYLLGVRFALITDHKALQHLQTMDNSNQRLIRWPLAVQQYHFGIKHRQCKKKLPCRQVIKTRIYRNYLRRGGMSGAFP